LYPGDPCVESARVECHRGRIGKRVRIPHGPATVNGDEICT